MAADSAVEERDHRCPPDVRGLHEPVIKGGAAHSQQLIVYGWREGRMCTANQQVSSYSQHDEHVAPFTETHHWGP